MTRKKHLAFKLRTTDEIKKKVPIFKSEAWERRKAVIANRVEKRLKRVEARKAERIAIAEEAGELKKNMKTGITDKAIRQARRILKRRRFAEKMARVFA